MQNLTNPNNSSNVKEYARYVNGDHQAQFYQAYGAFIHLRNVVAKNMIDMAYQLHVMKQLLPKDRFFDFTSNVLGMSQRNTFRYLKVYEIALKFFSENGRLDYESDSKLSLRAYQMIGDADNDELVTDIRELVANSGDRVDLSKIRTLVETRNNKTELKLAETIADVENLRRQLETERSEHSHEMQQKDFVILQQKNRLTERDSFSSNLNEQKPLLERENQELRNRPPNVITREVAVLPAEFASLEQAIESMNNLLETKKEQANSLDSQLTAMRQKIEESKEKHDIFVQCIAQLESVIAKWPEMYVRTLSSDPDIRQLVKQYAQTMIDFGQFIYKNA